MIARVAVPLPLPKTFDYNIPETFTSTVSPGCRVLVPFGNRVLTGVVVSLAKPPSLENTSSQTTDSKTRLKSILDVVDEIPALTDELLELTRWMADYYMCGWGEVIRAALPSGIDFQQQYIVYPTSSSRAHSGHVHPLLSHIDASNGLTLKELRQLDKSANLASLRRLERAGHVHIELALGKPKVRVKKAKHVELDGALREEEAFHIAKEQLPGKKQQHLLETLFLSTREDTSSPLLSDVLKKAGASSATAKSLEQRGLLRIFDQEVLRTPLGDLPAHPEKPPQHTLHKAQRAALLDIKEAISAERFQTFLLHGVTGSGKTEVYISALKEARLRGKTGIVLVPEIALTPQTVSRFRAHFGDAVAVLHSRMSLGERYDSWRHIRKGRFPIVIGPRSAVLAPLTNLGIVIVDEEHEGSYKQFDPAPRYHARDVAVMRAARNEAVCILGSATPSLESYHNAITAKKYTYLSMPERVPVPGKAAALLPTVSTVDLSLEKKKHRLPGILADAMKTAIALRIEREEQVILLQNRRGYSAILLCQTCGWSPTCDDCAVTLTYHKAQHHLRCHYCGTVKKFVRRCGQCGGTDLARLGAGTQRVEEEIEAHFPSARYLRMDLDTTSGKNAHHKILDQFGRGAADILIGTQMVAKGLDFSRVTLVGVINADVGMHLPDFRADERLFQLLTQVAGRAGRASRAGEVLLQTRNPKHPVIRFAMHHDYEQFARTTIEQRRELGYPPFGRIHRIEFKGPEEHVVEQLAQQWARCLTSREHVQILGPQPALISRVQKLYRHHVILKAHRSVPNQVLRSMITEATQKNSALPRDYRMIIDIDAVSLF